MRISIMDTEPPSQRRHSVTFLEPNGGRSRAGTVTSDYVYG